MGRILVVDDKELMRDSVATTLVRKGHTVSAVPGGAAALEKLTQRTFDTIVTDLQMPEMDGIALLEAVRHIDDQIPVVLMTAYGTIETAVQAMKHGAYDYILKPFNGDVLQVTVEKAIEHARLVRENQILRAAAAPAGSGPPRGHAMIGTSATMTQFRSRLERIADSHGTVLISGESGSGKEVAADLIHARSPRAEAPMLAINCAALSTNLLESELFGHEKGAFTGADRLRKGRFELADGGTLLLDEISEIAPEIQAKLLRVLQERTFERVGSSTSRSVDVRVVATTNRELSTEVRNGRFRQDLFFRLNVLPMVMPPLREHREDVPDLVAHFLDLVARREGKPVKRPEAAALEALAAYGWPGNVRELQNICERAAVLAKSDVIEARLIEPWLRSPVVEATEAVRSVGFTSSMIEARDSGDMPVDPRTVVCDGQCRLEDIERETIIATLVHHNGHRQRSATALGIGVRTLGLKLKKWKELHLVAESL